MMTEFTGGRYGACMAVFNFFERSATCFPASLLVATACVFAITGCLTSAEQKNKWVFSCPDGYEFTAVFSRDSESVTLKDETQKLKLDLEQSASGARYTDGTAVFWNKGVMARVDYGEGVVHQECQGNSN